MNKNEQKNEQKNQIEEIINLAREEKLSEEEIIKEAIQEKIKQINELQEKNKELNKQLLYLKAEFDNYRKRVEKEKKQKFILGKVSIIEKIISIYEMFNLAIKSLENLTPKNDADNKVFAGIKLLHKELENFFVKEGIKKIECENTTFNPELHEVVEFQETDDTKPDMIVEVISDGYILCVDGEEYVLRPAKVKVAKPKQEKIEKEDVTKPDLPSSNVKEGTDN